MDVDDSAAGAVQPGNAPVDESARSSSDISASRKRRTRPQQPFRVHGPAVSVFIEDLPEFRPYKESATSPRSEQTLASSISVRLRTLQQRISWHVHEPTSKAARVHRKLRTRRRPPAHTPPNHVETSHQQEQIEPGGLPREAVIRRRSKLRKRPPSGCVSQVRGSSYKQWRYSMRLEMTAELSRRPSARSSASRSSKSSSHQALIARGSTQRRTRWYRRGESRRSSSSILCGVLRYCGSSQHT